MKIVMITGANGCGKTLVVKSIIATSEPCGWAKMYGKVFPVIMMHGKKYLIIGKYSNAAICGADLLNHEMFWKYLRRGEKYFGVIFEGQRFGYGEAHKRLIDFAKKRNHELWFVWVKADPFECWKRVRQRQKKGYKIQTLMKRTALIRYWYDVFPFDTKMQFLNGEQ